MPKEKVINSSKNKVDLEALKASKDKKAKAFNNNETVRK